MGEDRIHKLDLAKHQATTVNISKDILCHRSELEVLGHSEHCVLSFGPLCLQHASSEVLDQRHICPQTTCNGSIDLDSVAPSYLVFHDMDYGANDDDDGDIEREGWPVHH